MSDKSVVNRMMRGTELSNDKASLMSCEKLGIEDFGRVLGCKMKICNGVRRDPGCRACGNPAYPDCKASCPMFDD